jgi:hypothetical protein
MWALFIFVVIMARARSEASAEDLVALLEPVAAQYGKSFLRYDDSKKVELAKTDPKAIAKYSYVAAAIHPAGLVHSRSAMRSCCQTLCDKFAPAWALSPEAIEDWPEVMTNRLMNFLSTINYAEKRKAPPKWVAELPWHAAGASDIADGAAVASQTPLSPTASTTSPRFKIALKTKDYGRLAHSF